MTNILKNNLQIAARLCKTWKNSTKIDIGLQIIREMLKWAYPNIMEKEVENHV